MHPIVALYEANGHTNYDHNTNDLEPVTEIQHAAQAAHLAKHLDHNKYGYTKDEMVLAFLLHDIGHMLALDKSAPNNFHEELGFQFLLPLFGEKIAFPCRLHCQAKRYLVTNSQKFFDSLSTVSKQSYLLQGGKMTDGEMQKFTQHPYFEVAVLFRSMEEQAKNPKMQYEPFHSYESLITKQLNLHLSCNPNKDRIISLAQDRIRQATQNSGKHYSFDIKTSQEKQLSK